MPNEKHTSYCYNFSLPQLRRIFVYSFLSFSLLLTQSFSTFSLSNSLTVSTCSLYTKPEQLINVGHTYEFVVTRLNNTLEAHKFALRTGGTQVAGTDGLPVPVSGNERTKDRSFNRY